MTFARAKSDTSRFSHGAVYHALFDRPLAEARRRVVDLIPTGSTVIDIASGTGELCFDLAALKDCRVVGIDLSLRMIEYAKKRNEYDAVRFEYRDATDLTKFDAGTFDFATVLFLLHEIPRPDQIAVIQEALRVARKTVLVDSFVPLPKNLHGIALRVVEAIGGSEHYRSFADYLANGGISSLLTDCRTSASVVHRSVFWHGCREIVILSNSASIPILNQ